MQDMPSSDTNTPRSREDLLDKIEGLQADLHEAVSVAVSGGALSWARLNYPDHPSLRTGSKDLMAPVAPSRRAFNHAIQYHENMIDRMRKHMNSGGLLFVHLEEPLDIEGVENTIGKHEFAINALRDILDAFEPEASTSLQVSLRKMAMDVAKAERERCEGAVAKTCAAIQGTPYIAGPRRFCEAIRALPKVEDTLGDVAIGIFGES